MRARMDARAEAAEPELETVAFEQSVVRGDRRDLVVYYVVHATR
jgi:hypothetical protein